MSEQPALAYKVLTADQKDSLLKERIFHGAPVDLADGYIHLSSADQLAGTLDKHFAGQVDLYVAAVDLQQLGDKVRWEAARGGELFPHLYAALPLSAVTNCAPVQRDEQRKVLLPG